MTEIKLIAKPIELFKKLEDHAPQHLFIIKIDNNGDKYAIRGGPKGGDGFINWLTADLEVMASKYKSGHPDCPDDPDRECAGWDKWPSHTLAVGDEVEIRQYWEKAVSRAEWINQQRFDYKLPIEELKELYSFSFGGHLNSNTAAKDIVEAMGIEFKLPKFKVKNGEEREVYAPGYDGVMEHSRVDIVVNWFRELDGRDKEYVKRDSYFLHLLQEQYLESTEALGTKAQLKISQCIYKSYVKMKENEDSGCVKTSLAPSVREINKHKYKIYEYVYSAIMEDIDVEAYKILGRYAEEKKDCEIANIFKHAASSKKTSKVLLELQMSEEFHEYEHQIYEGRIILDRSDYTREESQMHKIEEIVDSCSRVDRCEEL